MSQGFAILRASGDVLFFDTITQLTEKYAAAVSKHPLANGAYVVDHSTKQNPRFSISGVLSDADFNVTRPTIQVADISTTKQYINSTQTVYPVQIAETSSINKFFPEVVAQFTKDNIPDVYVTPQAKAKTAQAVKQNLIEMWDAREVFKFFEYDDGTIPNVYANCVITNLDFKEDVNTGEGVFPVLEFEQVKFAVVQDVQVVLKNKGRQNPTSSGTKSGTDSVANAPSSYSGQSVTDFRGAGSNTE
ncbi:phage baseplate protein [Pseudomonas sp. NPDC089428]|uniref:phage baseplate protein n=1 Tax=Pseudomonas sp. NPDC089428 TaxID=3364467 RepID=UPI0037FC1F43